MDLDQVGMYGKEAVSTIGGHNTLSVSIFDKEGGTFIPLCTGTDYCIVKN